MIVAEIFTKPGCGWAERNFAVLIEKRIPFRAVMSCTPDGQKTSEFRGLAPYGKTPVLRLGADIVWESAIINEYLDDRFPRVPMRHGEAFGRAQERLWSFHADAILTPSLRRLLSENVDEQTDGLTSLVNGIGQLAQALNARVDDGPLWNGVSVSLIDLAYNTFFQAMQAVENSGTITVPQLSPEMLRWRDAIAVHPSVKAARDLANGLSLDRAVVDYAVGSA